tara:strand:- start:1125 stop:1601 length:477 start_codon:yes stop_codon:yes gene_type:complete
MGYRSDVVIAVAMGSKKDLDELMAVYALNIFVQKENLIPEWEIGEYEDAWVAMYKAEGIKWYDNYDDVKGFEALTKLAENFWEERNMPYAYRFIRIGEEDNDIEISCNESDCNGSDDNRGDKLADTLADALYISRQINNELEFANDNVSDSLTQEGTD